MTKGAGRIVVVSPITWKTVVRVFLVIEVLKVVVGNLVPNPYQPRRNGLSEGSISELADSTQDKTVYTREKTEKHTLTTNQT